MFEKVNPSHPDKIADRIAGTIVDKAYQLQEDPRIAVEVLIGHGHCHIIAETSISIPLESVKAIVKRISGIDDVDYDEHPQDVHLSDNQKKEIRCGDNGIFKGCPVTDEQIELCKIAENLYARFPYDGKYILDGDKLIICQSNATEKEIRDTLPFKYKNTAIVNPLGEWTGGLDVDTGATNRKLGSDLADSVTGAGCCGKDFSKADVSASIYVWILSQLMGKEVNFSCAIGDTDINEVPYSIIVNEAKKFIDKIGGFEKFAEWGIVRTKTVANLRKD